MRACVCVCEREGKGIWLVSVYELLFVLLCRGFLTVAYLKIERETKTERKSKSWLLLLLLLLP